MKTQRLFRGLTFCRLNPGKTSKLWYPAESKEGGKSRQRGKEVFEGSCYRFLLSQSKCAGFVEVLGHSHGLYHRVGRGRQLGGQLHGDVYFTFFSLRGNKAPGLSSLICGSIRVLGSTKFFSPTSLTVHFWKTWRMEKGEGGHGDKDFEEGRSLSMIATTTAVKPQRH